MILIIILFFVFVLLILTVAYVDYKEKAVNKWLKSEILKYGCEVCGEKFSVESLWIHQRVMLRTLDKYKAKNPTTRIDYQIPKCICKKCMVEYDVSIVGGKFTLLQRKSVQHL